MKKLLLLSVSLFSLPAMAEEYKYNAKTAACVTKLQQALNIPVTGDEERANGWIEVPGRYENGSACNLTVSYHRIVRHDEGGKVQLTLDVRTEEASIDWGSIEFTSSVSSISCETSPTQVKISSRGKSQTGWSSGGSETQTAILSLKDGKIVKSEISYRRGGTLFSSGRKEQSVCLHN